MFNIAVKSNVKLNCTEQAFPEFPNLLYGTQVETGVTYFDATLYLNKDSQKKSINDFFNAYKAPIDTLCISYGLDPKEICVLNERGHYLIDGNLSYLFISFVEPNFLAFMCDRIHELFSEGITVSDTYIATKAKNRFSIEILKQILENGKNGE